MTLISCPDCGRTVASVSSKCPKCGSLLSQYRFMQGQSGSLTECRRCARKVLTQAATCPFCGAPHPGRRVPYAAVALLVGLAVPVMVFAALRARPTPTPPPLVMAAPRHIARPAAQPGVVAPAGDIVPAPLRTPPPPAGLEPAVTAVNDVSQAPSATPGLLDALTKWTLDWTNVREGRGLETAVVRVLRPGLPIHVNDRQDGWWATYLDGRLVGYVAGSLLGDQPPGGVPPEQLSPDRG